MKMRTKSISALLLASITMVPAAVIPATSYNDTIKTNFSHPISNVPGKSPADSKDGDVGRSLPESLPINDPLIK
jgi:hypothetical protein